MPIFEYQAVNAKGKSVKGLIDADSQRAARQKLRATGIYPTVLVEGSAVGEKGKGAEREGMTFADLFSRINNQDVAMMTRQLATLVGASIPLVEALTALVEQVENIKLKKVLTSVRDQVNEGSSLADAMKPHPKVFSHLYVNMIRAGESSGTLHIVLFRLAEFTMNQLQMTSKIKGAMAYPIIMVIVMMGVVGFLTTYLIPKISVILHDLDIALPWYTQMMMSISSFMKSYWWAVGLGLFGIYFGFRQWFKTDNGAIRRDAFLLRVALFGNLIRKVAIARFSRTLSTLLNGGVPIISAMNIVSNVVNNRVLSAALESARESISEGSSLAGPLKASGMFPPMVIHMISVGEKSGELEDMLNQVADAYEFEVSTAVETLTKVMEPILILALAVVVVFILISVLIPLLSMTDFA